MSTISALVVDDSATSRTLLTKILKKMDIHCEQACSGEDALSQLTWFQPNYIFLDHLMPGMDGFETLKEIKRSEQTKHIPVIMYTSQHAHNYYEEAHRLGAAGVISKQIDRDKLYLMLKRLTSAEKEKDESEVPTVFNEVQHSISKTVESEATNAKLFARISTLEAACEELHEENRNLRIDVSKWAADQSEQKTQGFKLAVPQLIITAFLALSLFASTFTWFTTQKIEQGFKNTQIQMEQVNELIDEIIILLEHDKSSPTRKAP